MSDVNLPAVMWHLSPAWSSASSLAVKRKKNRTKSLYAMQMFSCYVVTLGCFDRREVVVSKL